MKKVYLGLTEGWGGGVLGINDICLAEFNGKIGVLSKNDKDILLGAWRGKSVYLTPLSKAKVNRAIKDFVRKGKDNLLAFLSGKDFYCSRFYVLLRFNEIDLFVEDKNVKKSSAMFDGKFDVCIVGAFTEYTKSGDYYNLINTNNGRILLNDMIISNRENIENLLNLD